MLRTLLAEVERLTGELEKIDTRWHMAALDADTLRATVAEQGAALAEIQSACDAGDLHSAKLHCRAALASAQSAQPVQRTD
jgi:hypothetical protein